MSASQTIAAIGNFDGVHRGHRLLLEQTIEFAVSHKARSGAVVFDPHPRRYFRPQDPPFLITQAAVRNALIMKAGVDAVSSLIFDRALAALSPEAFVVDVLKGRLGLAGVAVGADFRFGAQRAGDAKTLAAACESVGMRALIIEPMASGGDSEKIGSSAIRQAISAGGMKRAAALLGRRWAVSGVVEEGRRLGRTLGFATANLTLGELIEPRKGVYAVRACVDGASFDAIANFGRRPTVGSDTPLLETHLFDFAADIYGRTLEVEFVDLIRDEIKFNGLDALKAQIAKDCLAARQILAAANG